MNTHVALIRGINVGTAKSVPMAELATVFEQLGYDSVKTVLRSGNVVFRAAGPLGKDAAASVEAALRDATGVGAGVLLLDARRFTQIADGNPLEDVSTDGSKAFVTFFDVFPTKFDLPATDDLAPELIAAGEHALYQWIPAGSMQTRVPKAFWKQFEGTVTTRNWNTVLRLRQLLN
jgi:uncharacterized protein (DUF1697 family)